MNTLLIVVNTNYYIATSIINSRTFNTRTNNNS